MSGVNKKYLREHKLFRIRNKNIIVVFPLIALLVVLTVFWCLKLVGITVTSDALCEVEPHTHSSECYNGEELICNKPEHTHTSDCFPDKTVDTETANDWTKTFNHIAISNNVPENLVAIASTQVGYSESDRNYEFNSHAQITNYSRYGEWYGNPYGEWNTIFVSFCMNYANAKDAKAFSNASAESMRIVWRDKNLYSSVISYTPSRGDVVFFDTNSDGKADRTGIVIHKSDNLLMTIEVFEEKPIDGL